MVACAMALAGCIDSGLYVCATSGRVCGEGLACVDAIDA